MVGEMLEEIGPAAAIQLKENDSLGLKAHIFSLISGANGASYMLWPVN